LQGRDATGLTPLEVSERKGELLMSSSAGIGGAFGLLLSEFPSVAAIYGDLKLYVNQALDREVAAEPGELEGAMEVLQIRDRLIGAFAEDRIHVPASAALLWTGSEADRLAHCETPADEWILGFGVFTKPWDYPPMDESFRKSASFHSWVWLE
jgi:hypothetical protein